VKLLLSTAALAAVLCAPSLAGEFSVAPVRMELGAAARTGVFTVRNEGRERLSFQVSAMQWTQDAQGRDQYTDTTDIVYFPRILSIEGGQEALVRVGIKQPLVQTEKTYRVFIEELPVGANATAPGTQVRVLVRFAPPIFVKPVKAEDRLDVERLQVTGGAVRLTLRNSGNQHQMVEAIRLQGRSAAGGNVYSMTLAERYLLAGTTKDYTAPLTREQCLAMASIATEVKTDKAAAQRQVDVNPAMCQ